MTLQLKVGSIDGVIADDWAAVVALVSKVNVTGIPRVRTFRGTNRRARKGIIQDIAICLCTCTKTGLVGYARSCGFVPATKFTVITLVAVDE